MKLYIKKIADNVLIIIASLFISFAVNAQTSMLTASNEELMALSEHKIEIQKEFTVNASPSLSISNQFGRIRIVEGANDKVIFKIKITGKGKNSDEAKKIAESIDINFNHNGNNISAETKHGSVRCNNCGRNVEYEVTVPGNTKLELKNQHGDIELNNAVEPLEVDISFGKLYANEISEAKLSIQHGGATVNKCGNMQIKSSFSQFQLGEIGIISGSASHGGIKIDELGTADFKSEFTNLTVEKLKKSFTADKISHGSLKINQVDESFSKIKVEANFTNIKIALTKNHNFKALLYTEFGNINTGNVVFEGMNLKKKNAVVGTDGKLENPSATVEISNNHGGITFE
jgi:hypothetical protein